MILGIALIMIGYYAVMPRSVSITLIVLGGVALFLDIVTFILRYVTAVLKERYK